MRFVERRRSATGVGVLHFRVTRHLGGVCDEHESEAWEWILPYPTRLGSVNLVYLTLKSLTQQLMAVTLTQCHVAGIFRVVQDIADAGIRVGLGLLHTPPCAALKVAVPSLCK